MFLHFLKKSLMKTLFEKTTFSLSFANNLLCIICDHLIFHVIDVFSIFRRRRFDVSNKRCLICRQKFSINTSCLCFFMRCLKNICRRVICDWMNCIYVFVRRTITRLSSFQLFEKLKNWKIKTASSHFYLSTFNYATSVISYFSYEYWREIFASSNLNKEYIVSE
jgi:hypothetical protein